MGRKRDEQGDATHDAMVAALTPSPLARRIRTALLAGVLAAVALGLGVWLTGWGIQNAVHATHASARTTGRITREGHARSCDETVAYLVDDRTYEVTLPTCSGSLGGPVTVAYDPHHPGHAVEPGWRAWRSSVYLAALGVLLLGVGGCIGWSLRHPLSIGALTPEEAATQKESLDRARDLGAFGT